MITPSDSRRVRASLPGCRSLFAALFLAAIGSHAQTLNAPFDASYSVTNLGTPPGVPGSLGGLTLMAGDPNTLLIGGSANNSNGAIYAVGVVRDGSGHITGFSGTATPFSPAPGIDGGLAYGPGGVLFFTTYADNRIGQIKPGSTSPDRMIDLGPVGVASSTGTLNFVASGFPGAGGLRIMSYTGGGFYSAALTPDGNGTFDIGPATLETNIGGGPEGLIWVPQGSPQFAAPSLLIAEFEADRVSAYELDSNGVPLPDTQRDFITNLAGAEGAFIDPVTNDFLFSTFGGGDRVLVVRGFAAPPPPTDPVTTILYTKGDAVPGQDATFTNFGLPAFDGTNIGFLARIKLTAGGSRNVIMGGSPIGVLRGAGDFAPDATGSDSEAVFASFKDPVFGGGAHAFIGNLKLNIGGTAGDSNTGIWSSASGSLRLLAREGGAAPGTGGEWKSFVAVALPQSGGAVFVAKLEVGTGSITADTDTVLFRESLTALGTVEKLLQEGDLLDVDPSAGTDSRQVKSFKALGNVGGSADHRRGHRADGGVLALVQFDGTQAIVEFPGDAGIAAFVVVASGPTIEALTGDSVNSPAGATLKKLGVPAGSSFGEAFFGQLNVGADVTAANDMALFAGDGDSGFDAIVREGDFAPNASGAVTAATFRTFRDPLFAGIGEHLAFFGTLKVGTGGVTTANDTGLWTDAGGTMHRVAGEGLAAPQTGGGLFQSFLSMAVDQDAAPLRNLAFTANLLVDNVGVTKTNKLGLWARDRYDVVHLLARNGFPIPPGGNGANATAIHALKAASGSHGQGRSMNGAGEIVYRAVRGVAGQCIVRVQMP